MSARLPYPMLLVPVFLAGCLLLGGSSQADVAGHTWLQLLSLAIIALAVYPATGRDRLRPAGLLACAVLAFSVWPLLQLMPLPAGLWQDTGNREAIVSGYRILAVDPLPSLPLSFAPERTLAALMALLPGLALLVLVTGGGRKAGPGILLRSIVGCGVASSLFAILQATLGKDGSLNWFGGLSRALPTGFFANANHQALLLLMCIPLLAAIAGMRQSRSRNKDARILRQVALILILLILLTGIWTAGSRAGYALALPVCAFSLLIWRSSSETKIHPGVLLLTGTILVLSLTLVFFSPALKDIAFADFGFNDQGRQMIIWPGAVQMLEDNWATGTGLGTFSAVFPTYEDPSSVNPMWINAAHNDFLQVAIELGVPGMVMCALAVGVWLVCSARAWTVRPSPYQNIRRAASVALLALMLHSIVDYPARTPLLMVVMLACAALLIWPDQMIASVEDDVPQEESPLRGVEL